jgi:hypothetical protein
MKRTYATVCATLAIGLLTGGLALAQGVGLYPPGVNPSNPQDLTNRSNPQSLTVPGGSNPQDLVRSPPPPQVVSPGPARDLGTASPPLSPSLSHTYTVNPTKESPLEKSPPKKSSLKKSARRKHGVTDQDGQ